jgi:hypothetical protein
MLMQSICPTCGGKGSIPDPQQQCASMNYNGPNGETVPRTFCRMCGGSGWVPVALASFVHPMVVMSYREHGPSDRIGWGNPVTTITTQHVAVQNLRREPPTITG